MDARAEALITAVQGLTGRPGVGLFAVEGGRVARRGRAGRLGVADDVVHGWVTALAENRDPGGDPGGDAVGAPSSLPTGVVLAPARRDGHLVAVVVAAWFPPQAARVPAGAAAAVHAVTELWAGTGEQRDPLTGLVGRGVLMDHLRLANLAAWRTGEIPAVLFCDVDGLTAINDHLGHGAGDQLLRAIADRLVEAVRPADTVARLGGDEFVILCPALADVTEATPIAARLHHLLAAKYPVGPTPITASASIGVAIGPFADPEEALQQADLALSTAKRQGRGVTVYDADLHATIRWHLQVQASFPAALRRGQLRLHYQPQYRLSSGRLTVVEALLRWQHPERGLLRPADFLPVVEAQPHASAELADWVTTTACRQAHAWTQRQGAAAPRIAVNVSPRHLATGHLPDLVRRALADSGLPGDRLQLEVTETSLLADPVDAGRQLRDLHDRGVTVALDDFGVAYSSLSLLRDLPVDTLKIDQSFTRDLLTDPRAAAIVAAVVRLGHRLHATVCGEGVETADQLATLRHAGCDDAQGDYLHPPVPAYRLPRHSWRRPTDPSHHNPHQPPEPHQHPEQRGPDPPANGQVEPR